LASYIPRASLAGLLMLAAFRMVDYKQLLFHLRATRFDALIVIATALAAVFVSVEFCILIGVFLSFVLFVPRAAQAQLAELTLGKRLEVRERTPDDPPRGPMLLFNLEGQLFFGAVPDMERHLSHIELTLESETRVVVLFVKRARNPDAAFLSLLGKFLRHLQERQIALILCGVRADLARALRSTGLDLQVGLEQILPETAWPDASTEHGVLRGFAILGKEAGRSSASRSRTSSMKETASAAVSHRIPAREI
jgi:SulP family sulfate permease